MRNFLGGLVLGLVVGALVGALWAGEDVAPSPPRERVVRQPAPVVDRVRTPRGDRRVTSPPTRTPAEAPSEAPAAGDPPVTAAGEKDTADVFRARFRAAAHARTPDEAKPAEDVARTMGLRFPGENIPLDDVYLVYSNPPARNAGVLGVHVCSSEDLLEGLRRAASAPSDGARRPETDLARTVAQSLVGRRTPAPLELILTLLAHGQSRVRDSGVILGSLLSEADARRLETAVAGEDDGDMRRLLYGALQQVLDNGTVDALGSASVARIVDDAASEDLDLRVSTFPLLGHAGDAGARIAVRALRQGGVEEDLAAGLVGVALRGGRLTEILDGRLSQTLTHALADRLEDAAEADLPRVREASSQLVAAALGMEEFSQPVFDALVASGMATSVRRVALDDTASAPVRACALYALMDCEDDVHVAAATYAQLLGDPTSSVEFRRRLVEEAWDYSSWEHVPAGPLVEALRLRVEQDTNPWIRDEAARVLEFGFEDTE